MTARSNKMISDFAEKPTTQRFYEAIDTFVLGLGAVEKSMKSQVSYKVNRKFLWLWAYEKTADGTLYMNVTLDHPKDDKRLHKITQVSAHRWNHQAEVKSIKTAESQWIRELIRAGFQFANQ